MTMRHVGLLKRQTQHAAVAAYSSTEPFRLPDDATRERAFRRRAGGPRPTGSMMSFSQYTPASERRALADFDSLAARYQLHA